MLFGIIGPQIVSNGQQVPIVAEPEVEQIEVMTEHKIGGE